LTIMTHLRKYFALTSDQRRILTEAILFLFSAKVILTLMPVRRVLKAASDTNTSPGEADLNVLNVIRWALSWAVRLSFWKNRCLVQSVAGWWMIKRRGIACSLSLGVRHDDRGKVIAHAWLKAGDFEVVEKGGDYLELYLV